MNKKQKRILHIVGGMNRGGVETWLMHVLRNIDRSRYQMDFLVHTTQPCAYDEEIRSLGSKIIPCLSPSRPIRYGRKLYNILRSGQYDVVHSHVHHYSGWTLFIARLAGIPVRIAHSHTSGQKQKSTFRLIYEAISRKMIWQYSTHGIGISQKAAVGLFGKLWEVSEKMRVILYGFDFSSFSTLENKVELKRQLDISPSSYVIGHVGRFVPVKNHALIADVFENLLDEGLDIHLLLVGDGPLYNTFQARFAKNENMKSHCSMVGNQSNVAHFLGAMDVFLFPSLYEGLGIVLIEAQAAGLPCVYSDVVPEEVAVIPELVQTLSLNEPAKVWAGALLAYKQQKPAIAQPEALRCIEQSPFNIETSIQSLTKIYDGC